MLITCELYWIHIGANLFPDQFWNRVRSLDHVRSFKETRRDAAGLAGRDRLLEELLSSAAPEATVRLAFLHLHDVRQSLGMPIEALVQHRIDLEPDPNLVTVYFTTGTAEPQNSPPVLSLTEHIIPRIEAELLPLLADLEGPERLQSLLLSWSNRTGACDSLLLELVAIDVILQTALAVLESDPPKYDVVRYEIEANPCDWFGRKFCGARLESLVERANAKQHRLLTGTPFADFLRAAGSPDQAGGARLADRSFLRAAHESYQQALSKAALAKAEQRGMEYREK